MYFTSLRQQARPGPEHHFNIFVAARPMARSVPAGSDSLPCSSVHHTVCFCFLLKVMSECLQARWPSLTSRTTRTALLLLSTLPLRLACMRWTSNMMASTSQVQHLSEEFTETQEMFVRCKINDISCSFSFSLLSLTGSPLQFYVDYMNSGNVSAYGPGLIHGTVNKPAVFTVNTKDAGEGEKQSHGSIHLI